MEEVCKEWSKAWQKVKSNYDKDIRKVLTSSSGQKFLKFLGKYIRKGQLILEAGCGYGHKCVLFSKHCKANVVVISNHHSKMVRNT